MQNKGQIYLITNMVTWKQYVGQTTTHYNKNGKLVPAGYVQRWKKHVSDAKRYINGSKFQSSIVKYGEKNFEIELLEECQTSDLDEREIYFIKVLDTFTYGYNSTPGGKQFCVIKKESEKIDPKDIDTIKISSIGSGNKDYIYVILRLKNNHVVRVNFIGSDIKRSLQVAIDYSINLISIDNIILQEHLKPFSNLIFNRIDDRLINNSVSQKRDIVSRYEKLKELDIKRIRVEKRLIKKTELATLVIYQNNSKRKNVYFGGKFIKFDEALDDAIKLANKLSKSIYYQQFLL